MLPQATGFLIVLFNYQDGWVGYVDDLIELVKDDSGKTS